MSSPRKISPILDGYTLDEVVSRHGAAQCCRVTRQATGEAFITKVISIPSSTAQLDALVMAGAFAGPSDAISYFKEQARDVLNDAKILRYMATLGGFVDYDCVQVVPAAEGKGFEVYLLSPYRQNLQQILQCDQLSQLDVLNMGLDLCAALTVCRHAGYCYVGLKPGNVFRDGQHYRIGDLGFLPLSALNKTSLPEAFRSSYSPPELMDGTRPVNETADVYALGLILYQAYNGGALPGNDAIMGRLLLPPKFADYEMAEIILRACAPDPSLRWQSPEEMGRALMRYTQRNGMRDIPVVPPVLRELEMRSNFASEEFLPEEPMNAGIFSSMRQEEQEDAAPADEAFPHPVRQRSRPVRRENKAPRFKLSKGWIAISILAGVLIVELILSIWLFS